MAYGVLLLLSLFLLANLKGTDGGVGYGYLGSSIVCFSLLCLASNKYTVIRSVQKSVVPLILFLAYLCLSVLFDSLDINELKKVTIGTTNGIVFSLILGMLCSYTLATIYEISERSKLLLKFSLVLSFLYVGFLLLKSTDIFFFKLENIRDDLFLLADTNDAYQRPSAFILMQFLLLCSLTVVLSLNTNTTILKFFLGIIIFFVFLLAAVFMAMSQLIGSNSGLVTVCGLLLVWFTYLLISWSNMQRIVNFKRISFLNILYSFIGRNILIYFSFLSISLLLLAAFMFSFTEVNPEQIRILGFGSGEVSSVNSRWALLRDNFIEHFSYNPVFGHTQIDVITTGEGTYIHSILSILTHLGLVGWALFVWLLSCIYKDIKNMPYNDGSPDLFVNKSYKLYRLFVIPCILVFATFSAFFTWMPLWFCLGLLGIRFILNQKTRLNLS